MSSASPAPLTAFDELAHSLCAWSCARSHANFGEANDVPFAFVYEPSKENIVVFWDHSITKSSVESTCVPVRIALVRSLAAVAHTAKTSSYLAG